MKNIDRLILLTWFVVLVSGCSHTAPVLHFMEDDVIASIAFQWSNPDNSYLQELRINYELDQLLLDAADDYRKVGILSQWTQARWDHDGWNTPAKWDPISILEEAAAGKNFRCVEYAIVLAGVLNAVDIPARILGLKRSDVETRRSGAGHVVVEAYLRDQTKWIMIDPQWDTIPVLDGVPLNAVELEEALARKEPELSLNSLSGTEPDRYFRWITPYLYYFDVRLDNRYGQEKSKQQLMLVPLGALKPSVSQRKYPMKNMIYTHSTKVFYPKYID